MNLNISEVEATFLLNELRSEKFRRMWHSFSFLYNITDAAGRCSEERRISLLSLLLLAFFLFVHRSSEAAL